MLRTKKNVLFSLVFILLALVCFMPALLVLIGGALLALRRRRKDVAA